MCKTRRRVAVNALNDSANFYKNFYSLLSSASFFLSCTGNGSGFRQSNRHPTTAFQLMYKSYKCSCVFRCMCRRHTSVPKHYFGREFRVIFEVELGLVARFPLRKKYTYDTTCNSIDTKEFVTLYAIRRVMVRVQVVSLILATFQHFPSSTRAVLSGVNNLSYKRCSFSFSSSFPS